MAVEREQNVKIYKEGRRESKKINRGKDNEVEGGERKRRGREKRGERERDVDVGYSFNIFDAAHVNRVDIHGTVLTTQLTRSYLMMYKKKKHFMALCIDINLLFQI